MAMLLVNKRTRDGSEYYDFMLNRGPQHPGYGPVRLIVKVNGDYIEEARIDPGYVHRGLEKMLEYRTPLQGVPLAERVCFIDALNSTRAYAMAIERLLGLEMPEYVKLVRTFIAEVSRLTSHTTRLAMAGGAFGLHTAMMRALRMRERILRIQEAVTGGRFGAGYIIPGGLMADVPSDIYDLVERETRKYEERLKEYERMVLKNRIFQERTIGVGILDADEALRLGVTGPSLRGSGVKYDLRATGEYGVYDRIDFEPVVAERGEIYEVGDAYARVRVRYQEIRRSLGMIRELAKLIRDYSGERKISAVPKARLATLMYEPGEASARTERARGEVMFYVMAKKKSPYPYRVKIKSPSPNLMMAFLKLIKGARIADVPAIHMSLDECPGDLDRRGDRYGAAPDRHTIIPRGVLVHPI